MAGHKTKSGSCKFGKVTRGKRKGSCRKHRKAKK
jgi:hypothetical protein